jgi:hypothetical protein
MELGSGSYGKFRQVESTDEEENDNDDEIPDTIQYRRVTED